MFDNIGKKIKLLSIIFLISGVLGSLIYAIVLWAINFSQMFLTGFLCLVLGSFSSIIFSFLLHSWGDTVENVADIKRTLLNTPNNYTTATENATTAKTTENATTAKTTENGTTAKTTENITTATSNNGYSLTEMAKKFNRQKNKTEKHTPTTIVVSKKETRADKLLALLKDGLITKEEYDEEMKS